MNNSIKQQFGWHDIDWNLVNKKMFQQQVKIGVAYTEKDFGRVTQLQDNLV